MKIEVASGSVLLSGYLAGVRDASGPATLKPASAGPESPAVAETTMERAGEHQIAARSSNLLILSHGFPAGAAGALTTGHTYPELADHLAFETGWQVLSFNFRGTGSSGGDFSLGGWMDDLQAVINFGETLASVERIWLCGYSTGGALAMCVAADDMRVQGVAAMASPADFHSWAEDPARLLSESTRTGAIRTPGFPERFDEWSREIAAIAPLDRIKDIPPRPLLIVHGDEDTTVPVSESRLLADATHGAAELCVLKGAGHRLRHDPRAVALLVGWMERQVSREA